jgi:hypothetical protein
MLRESRGLPNCVAREAKGQNKMIIQRMQENSRYLDAILMIPTGLLRFRDARAETHAHTLSPIPFRFAPYRRTRRILHRPEGG